LRTLVFLPIIFFTMFLYGQEGKSNSVLDSIILNRNHAKNNNFSFKQRIEFAKKAIELSVGYDKDSTLLKSQKSLSSVYLNQWNVEDLKSINYQILELAERIKDSAALANANYILGFAFHEELKPDSAYFYYSKAVKQFKTLGKTENYLAVLSNMSDIQQAERDYIGAEINAIRALKTLKDLPRTEENIQLQWSRYNLIGIVSGELKNFDKALEYHSLAFNIIQGHPNAYYYRIYSKNNIASIYRRKGNYKKAKLLFKEILEDNRLKTKDSSSYSMITANLGYAQFLSGDYKFERVQELFKESFKLSNILNDKIGVMAISGYYSEFLQHEKQLDSSKKYADLAYKIAKETNTNDFIFQSLKIKSELEKDSSSHFLNEYIKLNDSLVNAERSIRNKFTRIDYETDTITQQKEAISKQNFWLVITSIGLLFSTVLLYIIKTQRVKNNELQLAQQQQEANEEIYNLMLSQQSKMDDARAKEKQRISQEIHDGILGRLFGARLSLDSLNTINTDDAISSREGYINELVEIEKDIRKVSHDLSTDFISKASFSEMLITLVETQCAAYNLEYQTKIMKDIIWESLTNKTKIHVYRIVQESLHNIYKHAMAKVVTIVLEQGENLISLYIIDDGVGYNKFKQNEGIGLKNIKSRVETIGGILNVESKNNQGTKIHVAIPI